MTDISEIIDSKSIDSKEEYRKEHEEVKRILNSIKLCNDTNVASVRPERFDFEDGITFVYTDQFGRLARVVDCDLDGRVQTLKRFRDATVVQMIAYDIEGHITQVANLGSGVMYGMYNLRKDKTVESQAKFVNVEDEVNNIAIYETMIFNEKGICVEKYNEAIELVFSDEMNVWMFKN